MGDDDMAKGQTLALNREDAAALSATFGTMEGIAHDMAGAVVAQPPDASRVAQLWQDLHEEFEALRVLWDTIASRKDEGRSTESTESTQAEPART